MNFDHIAAVATRLINKNGRDLIFNKLSATTADVLKPWRGAATPTLTETVKTKGTFVIGNTSIPTESRGLAFDWIDQDLLKIARHVVITPAAGLPRMEDHKVMTDDGKQWSIIWGQCLQPGSVRLLYVFGLKE